jgi:glycosyltransferase involved in cell wall biosynthesis
MRVVHIDTSREWRGGQTQLLNLVRARPEDHVIVHPEAPLRAVLAAEGIPHETVAFKGGFRGARRLRAALSRLDPGVVAAHTSHAHSLCLLAGYRKRLVVHRRLDFRARPSALRRWKYGAPGAYVAVSRAVGVVLEDLGVAKSAIWLAHDGVDPAPIEAATEARTELRAELGWPPTAKVVLAVGALVEHKGHESLLRAMVRVPGAYVIIAGEGPRRVVLERVIAETGLSPRARLLGHREDVHRLLKSCDLFCHPSIEEGMGQVVVEAMLAEAPVVATRAGGVPEVVGGYGRLVEVADIDALSAGIAEGLRRERSKHLVAGAQWARSEFSVQQMIRRTEAAYASLAQRRC